MPLRKLSAQRRELLEALSSLSALTSSGDLGPLVTQLYDTDLRTLEECLLQVVHVCVTHSTQEVQTTMQAFMLWLASRSLYLALRLSWMVDSMSSFYNAMALGDRVKHIQDTVESYAINQMQGRQPPTSGRATPASGALSVPPQRTPSASTAPLLTSPSSAHPVTPPPDELEIDLTQVMRKEARLKLFTDVRHFVTSLTDYSNLLRYFPDRGRRKEELRKRLREINTKLLDVRLFHPLGTSTDHVQWIVNIAVEECTVFSSRERAPYLIRYEVIVDDTATLQDPTSSRLRLPDGQFKISSTSDDVYVPTVSPQPQSDAATTAPTAPTVRQEEKAEEAEKWLATAMGESAEQRRGRVRRQSPWGSHPNWSMAAMIVKAGDDLRQEELALQLIHIFGSIWEEAGLNCSVHPYVALPTNADCGLLEVVEESNSMDGIKKACRVSSIQQFYARAFGPEDSLSFATAQRNFVETMAGYSVISYILQIKDRHNGNLMITRSGQLVHIDFGFLFVTSPGGWNFESAPFKLSQELVDVMGGQQSSMFNYYKVLVFQALAEARERMEELLSLVSLMVPFNTMPCFGTDPHAVAVQMRNRFCYDLTSDADYALYTKDLITLSTDNWRTRRYDQFQTLQNGII